MPAQIASTINFLLYEKDLPHNNKKRRLFVIGKQILSNGRVDEKKEGQYIVDFEITEFDTNKVTDWTLVFNDCLYHYKSGNNRHCHMTLFWALYMTEWCKETLQQSLSTVSSDVARTACHYIGTNLFAFSLNRQKILINLLKELNPNLQPVEINEVEIALKEIAPSTEFGNIAFLPKNRLYIRFRDTARRTRSFYRNYIKPLLMV